MVVDDLSLGMLPKEFHIVRCSFDGVMANSFQGSFGNIWVDNASIIECSSRVDFGLQDEFDPLDRSLVKLTGYIKTPVWLSILIVCDQSWDFIRRRITGQLSFPVPDDGHLGIFRGICRVQQCERCSRVTVSNQRIRGNIQCATVT